MEQEEILEASKSLFSVMIDWIDAHTPKDRTTNLDVHYILILALSAILRYYWITWEEEDSGE